MVLSVMSADHRQEIATFDVTDWTSYVAAQTGDGPRTGPVNTYPRRFVFIVNRVGAQFEWLNRAKRGLASFIVESMADGDEAMVVDVAHSTKVVQEFRAAKEETLKAVRGLSQMQIDYPQPNEYFDRGAISLLRNVYDRSIAEARRANYRRLAQSLETVPGLRCLYPDLQAGVCPYVLPVLVIGRQGFHVRLRELGIPAATWGGVIHPTLPLAAFPDAAYLYDHLVFLPIHQSLTDVQIDRMGRMIRDAATQAVEASVRRAV